MSRFPDDFIWGSATAAHQVEGNNKWNDWWRWEQQGGGAEPSENACEHYERYEEDFDLMEELHQNGYRFSIEWSRIEPEEGEFNEEAIQHYKDMIEAMRERDIEPFMTLHHFSNPTWFKDKGAFTKQENLEYFYRFVEKVSEEIDDVKYWVSINEPAVYSFSYLTDTWPTDQGLAKCFQVGGNLMRAHAKAREILQNDDPERKVGIAKNIQITECSNLIFKPAAKLIDWIWNGAMLNSLKDADLKFPYGSGDLEGEGPILDFVGVNYYTRFVLSFNLLKEALQVSLGSKAPNQVAEGAIGEGLETTKMGYEVYPEGFRKALEMVRDFDLPVYITENGISTDEDEQRQRFLKSHLGIVADAIEDGIDVKGYFYWSTIDNFEWDSGFEQRFGLIGVDYETQERTVRESARVYKKIIDGEIEV